jgi:hypothetical protein
VFRGVSHGDCVMGAYEISDSLTFPPRRRSAAERYRVSVRCFSCQRALSLVHVAHFVNTRIGMVSLMRKACAKHGFDMRKRAVRILESRLLLNDLSKSITRSNEARRCLMMARF